MSRFRPLETNFSWWLGNLAALRALPVAAGFADVRRLGFFRPPGAHRDTYVGLACQAARVTSPTAVRFTPPQTRERKDEEIDQG